MFSKIQLFALVTYVIAYISFNFNKIINTYCYHTCAYLMDDSVIPYGPYQNKIPITVKSAIVDNQKCTNKVRLLMNWYWDYDIDGIMMPNICLEGQHLMIQYTTKNGDIHRAHIDLVNKMLNSEEVMFGELTLV